MKHIGLHHFESCGEYRPAGGINGCPRCPLVCPTCGNRTKRPNTPPPQLGPED